jgi:hypothetical protein
MNVFFQTESIMILLIVYVKKLLRRVVSFNSVPLFELAHGLAPEAEEVPSYYSKPSKDTL